MELKYKKELEQGYSPTLVIEEASRCLLCHDAPCSKACPAGTSPDKFIRSVRFRNFKGAAETVRENNALGAICARVCPTEKLCQQGCSRSGIDRPIDIGRIQRYITDFEECVGMKILKVEEKNGKSVGIVGSGPSALQAAATLIKLGYDVEVYEKEKVLGGMLRYIPEFRLPNHIVDAEIKRIEELGVKFHTSVCVGKDMTISSLKEKHDAVILAVGLSYGKSLPMFEGNKNVVLAVDFLKEAKAKEGTIKVPESAIVIGGGDVAMDVVSTLKVLGCKHVSDVAYETFEEFRASKKELHHAQAMGVTIIDGYVPESIEDNVVTFKHRHLNGMLKLEAEKIILAIGQKADVAGLGVELIGNEVDSKKFKTNDEKVFVIGDIAKSEQGKTVVGGVRTGKEVAHVIHQVLGGKK